MAPALKMHRSWSVIACAVALGSFAGDGAAQEASCGCSGTPPSFEEALRDDGVEALVLAYVALGEGSPRKAPERAGAGEHSFPIRSPTTPLTPSASSALDPFRPRVRTLMARYSRMDLADAAVGGDE